ncbi:MAG: hypothetical protein JWQ30_700 [Sediminibacterium sp.]|nr:hypothetical protein [Sediminibacterium sp.]
MIGIRIQIKKIWIEIEAHFLSYTFTKAMKLNTLIIF